LTHKLEVGKRRSLASRYTLTTVTHADECTECLTVELWTLSALLVLSY